MANNMTSELPAPGGLVARFFGAFGSTTYVYWVQAVYINGKSVLAQSNTLTTASGPDHNNVVELTWNPLTPAIAYNIYRTTTTTAPTTGSAYLATVTGPGFTDRGDFTPSTQFVIRDGIRQAQARYDFATDGAGTGTLTLANSDTIPNGAVVTGKFVKSDVALTSGGSATIAIGTSAGSSTTSLLGATAVASYSLDAVQKLTPFTTPFVMTAAGTVTITVATAALLTGGMDIIVEYYNPVAL